MTGQEIADHLTAKYPLPFDWYAEQFQYDIRIRASKILSYLEDREYRIDEECDYCHEKYARTNISTTIRELESYSEHKDKEYYFCSEVCRDYFEDSYYWCDCGYLYNSDSFTSASGYYACKVCYADNVIQNGMNTEDLEDYSYWLDDYIFDALKENKWAREEVKRKYTKIRHFREFEESKKAIKYIGIKEGFLFVPFRDGHVLYIIDDSENDLAFQIKLTNVRSGHFERRQHENCI